jgi:methylthioxylose transferase
VWFDARVEAAEASRPAGAARRPGRAWPTGTATALALAALAVATVALGLIGHAAGLGLGTPLPPFFATWDPAIGPVALAGLAVLAAALAAAVPLARGALGTGGFLLAATALALAGRLGLGTVRDGVAGWYEVFSTDPEAANEYLPALPALDLGLGTFLDRFAELAPSLPIHASAHPPGMLLLLDGLGIDSARGMAALVIVAGVLAVPLTYALGRRLDLEEGRARIAALLCAFSPVAMLYGVTSADALFATLGALAALLLVAGGALTRIAGMAVLAVGSFFSWALLAIGAWSSLVVLSREGLRKALAVAIGAGVVLAGFYVALWAASGYDALGFLASAHEAYELGISRARPYLFWLFGSPVAFFVALGLPISFYAARALGRGADVAVALAVVVAVAALLGMSKAETERIWLFMAPLAVLAAAREMPRERLPLVLALLGAQAVAVELTLDTVW